MFIQKADARSLSLNAQIEDAISISYSVCIDNPNITLSRDIRHTKKMGR